MIQQNQKNMKECDKRNSHLSSKLHIIYISLNNDRDSVTKNFTPLHYTCRHFTSFHLKLNPTTLHFFPFKLHPITLHYTSLPSHLA